LLDFIDKYKFGIIATFAAYMFLFVYLQMSTYTQYFPITPFHEGARMENIEEIDLEPNQIEVGEEFQSDMKNMARDVNDKREKSSKEYYENQSSKEVEESVKDYEKKLFEESGGATERKRIQEEMESQKELEENKAKESDQPVAKTGGDKAYSGNVMVEWVLANRDPHKNDNWYVRNPGYTCGYGSNGAVAIDIKVNQNGDVTSAVYNPGNSAGANPCMIEQATKYAKLSRFKYDVNAGKIQSGTILYRFASQ
jgi:hypothetical protein